MRESITYKLTHPNTDEYSKLQKFAESFDHHIQESPGVVVHGFYRGDVCFGYCDTVYLPVTYPAFHPERVSPRDVVQVMNDWKSHIEFSGQKGYIGVPLNNRNGLGNFQKKQ
jgi:hypothetical protein